MGFKTILWTLTLILVFIVQLATCVENEWFIPVEHSWNGLSSFVARSNLRIILSSRADAPPIAKFSTAAKLSEKEKTELLKAAARGEPYRIRAPAILTDAQTNKETLQQAMSFTDSCRLVASQLHDVVTVSIDSSQSRLLSLVVQPVLLNSDSLHCDDLLLSANWLPDTFNTSVRVVDVVDGPAPDTHSYVQKLEKEREDRQRGQQQDNRSFLAKYWMYIVPVVVFVMLSGAMNPEQEAR